MFWRKGMLCSSDMLSNSSRLWQGKLHMDFLLQQPLEMKFLCNSFSWKFLCNSFSWLKFQNYGDWSYQQWRYFKCFLRKIAQYVRLNRERRSGFSAFMSVFCCLASINRLSFVMPSCLHFLNDDNYEFFIISVKISEDLLMRECLISVRYYCNTAD